MVRIAIQVANGVLKNLAGFRLKIWQSLNTTNPCNTWWICNQQKILGISYNQWMPIVQKRSMPNSCLGNEIHGNNDIFCSLSPTWSVRYNYNCKIYIRETSCPKHVQQKIKQSGGFTSINHPSSIAMSASSSSSSNTLCACINHIHALGNRVYNEFPILINNYTRKQTVCFLLVPFPFEGGNGP